MSPSEAYGQLRAANDARAGCEIGAREGHCDSCDSRVLYALGDLVEAGVPLERETFTLTDQGRAALAEARAVRTRPGGGG